MIKLNNPHLLYIEPSIESLSNFPLIDFITRKITASFRKSKHCCDWKGLHGASTGVCSTSHDYSLSDGKIVNSLCIYYLAWHRTEVPENQLKIVSRLKDGEEEPTAEELHIVEIEEFKRHLNNGMIKQGNDFWRCYFCGMNYVSEEIPKCSCREDSVCR